MDGQPIGQVEAALAKRLARDLGGRPDLEEGEVFEGAGDLVQRHLVGRRRIGRDLDMQPRRAIGAGQDQRRLAAAADIDPPDALGGQVGDVAVEPELRVGIDGEPSLGQPGLALAGAADIDALGHVALGADPAAAEDQLGQRRALAVQHPQQQGGAARRRPGSSTPSRACWPGSAVRASARRSSVRPTSISRSFSARTG